jgi:hypothetical protein
MGDDGDGHDGGMGDGHTIMNLVKSALGAGSLSLPKAFRLVVENEETRCQPFIIVVTML